MPSPLQKLERGLRLVVMPTRNGKPIRTMVALWLLHFPIGTVQNEAS